MTWCNTGNNVIRQSVPIACPWLPAADGQKSSVNLLPHDETGRQRKVDEADAREQYLTIYHPGTCSHRCLCARPPRSALQTGQPFYPYTHQHTYLRTDIEQTAPNAHVNQQRPTTQTPTPTRTPHRENNRVVQTNTDHQIYAIYDPGTVASTDRGSHQQTITRITRITGSDDREQKHKCSLTFKNGYIGCRIH